MPEARSDDPASANNSNSAKDDVESTHALPEQCAKVHSKVWELLQRESRDERVRQVQRQTRISLGVIAESLERYRCVNVTHADRMRMKVMLTAKHSSLHELSFSYNGGKDCLVLLILYLAALHSHAIGERTPPSTTSHHADNTPHKSAEAYRLPNTLRSVYIVTPNPFPAVTDFVDRSAAEYHLSLDRYYQPMKEAFASYLADYPTVKGIFVGTRRTDPHGGSLTHFDPTTDDWPSFMRIHPVIDWHYADIWTFIKEVGVEYCELYDQGYTSLGGTNDTHPNPALAITEGGDVEGDGMTQKDVRYRPAYELVEDEEERLGRDFLKKTTSA